MKICLLSLAAALAAAGMSAAHGAELAIPPASLDQALRAAGRGDGIEASKLVDAACAPRPRDAACLEARATLAFLRGDPDAASPAALALVAVGSTRQAFLGASILSNIGAGRQALRAILARPGAQADPVVAGWASPAAIALGEWSIALEVAQTRADEGSWRLELCAAVAAAQLDMGATAKASLARAEQFGAPFEALRQGRLAVVAAEAREAMAMRALKNEEIR